MERQQERGEEASLLQTSSPQAQGKPAIIIVIHKHPLGSSQGPALGMGRGRKRVSPGTAMPVTERERTQKVRCPS